MLLEVVTRTSRMPQTAEMEAWLESQHPRLPQTRQMRESEADQVAMIIRPHHRVTKTPATKIQAREADPEGTVAEQQILLKGASRTNRHRAHSLAEMADIAHDQVDSNEYTYGASVRQ